ncbi:unnamed protein product [Symbiodinium natans]|uniref:Uncharacterized protein n=1 Tax=Symbiodinium natans TaxID=878477 RepID=A0A812SZ20_9DINO|nr:unnamed protein product [Symbiodinium natans]
MPGHSETLKDAATDFAVENPKEPWQKLRAWKPGCGDSLRVGLRSIQGVRRHLRSPEHFSMILSTPSSPRTREVQNAAEQSAQLLETANTEVLKEARILWTSCRCTSSGVSFLLCSDHLGTRCELQDQDIPKKALEDVDAQARSEE